MPITEKNDSQAVIPLIAYQQLILALDVGNSIGEDDALLIDATTRVETSVFQQLLKDDIDIVLGTKGSGKTALFRVFVEILADYLRSGRSDLVEPVTTIKGVEVSGDPAFLKFVARFKELSEVQFQNFWRIYILSLVNAHLNSDQQTKNALKKAPKEMRAYRKIAKDHGFPMPASLLTFEGLTQWAFSKMPDVKFKIGLDPTGAPSGTIELSRAAAEEDAVPVFVNAVSMALEKMLTKAGIRIWVMLDRLDEIFERRSAVETTALRALLRTTRSFKDKNLRLKIFIRNDIVDDITDSSGFAGLTHFMSRKGDTLRWTREQIEHLILSRLCAKSEIRHYFQVDIRKLRSDEQYRKVLFRRLLPDRLRAGPNQSKTLDWIYKHCEDGNGNVTPRDVIDLLQHAKSHQIDLVRSQSTPNTHLLSARALMYGFARMAEAKRGTLLKAEFHHLWPSMQKFEAGRADHDASSLRRILGPDWKATTDHLCSIGFMKHDKSADSYSVPFLYRPCLNIKQGRDRHVKRARNKRAQKSR